MGVVERCGWGSGALYYAEMLPKSRVTAFSNSKTQKQYIDGKAKEKGLENLTVITGNVVDHWFEPESFDRVVSIEVSGDKQLSLLGPVVDNSFVRCSST